MNDYQCREMENDDNCNNLNTTNNINTNNNIEKTSEGMLLINKNNLRSKNSVDFPDLPE